MTIAATESGRSGGVTVTEVKLKLEAAQEAGVPNAAGGKKASSSVKQLTNAGHEQVQTLTRT